MLLVTVVAAAVTNGRREPRYIVCFYNDNVDPVLGEERVKCKKNNRGGKKKKLANRSKWKQYENRYGGIKRDWLPNMARNGFLERRRSFMCACVCVCMCLRECTCAFVMTTNMPSSTRQAWLEEREDGLWHEFLLQGWMMPFGLQQALKFLFYTSYLSIFFLFYKSDGTLSQYFSNNVSYDFRFIIKIHCKIQTVFTNVVLNSRVKLSLRIGRNGIRPGSRSFRGLTVCIYIL